MSHGRSTAKVTDFSADAASDLLVVNERAYDPKKVARKVVLDAVAGDPIATSEVMVEQLMAHLATLPIDQLAKLSKRLQLRLYRDGRWVYLKDGRVSSQLLRPRPKRQAKRPPCCAALRSPSNDD